MTKCLNALLLFVSYALYFFKTSTTKNHSFSSSFFFFFDFSHDIASFLGYFHNSPTNEDGQLSECDEDPPQNNGHEWSQQEDHRLFDHKTYKRLYKWLYYSYSKNDLLCKTCIVFY